MELAARARGQLPLGKDLRQASDDRHQARLAALRRPYLAVPNLALDQHSACVKLDVASLGRQDLARAETRQCAHREEDRGADRRAAAANGHRSGAAARASSGAYGSQSSLKGSIVWAMARAALAMIVFASSLSCAGGAAPATGDAASPADEMVLGKRCGDSPDTWFRAYTVGDLETYSDCTVLVGHFQLDSVDGLSDLAALKNVKRIDGFLNVFRSPGFVTLHGLENLEVIEGHVAIHLNPNLVSIAALGALRAVTGNLYIVGNDRLPQSEVDALGTRVTVGGMKDLGAQPVGP